MVYLDSLKTIPDNDIQLVFFDIDGTVLSTQGDYSQKFSEQIRRLHSLGIKTAIASGRPSYAARFLVDELQMIDMGVFCTGAEIYHPKTQQHVHVHALNNEDVQAIYQRVKALGIYCELYTPTGFYVDEITPTTVIHAQHLRVEPIVADGSTIIEQDTVMKLLLGHPKDNNQNSSSNLHSLAGEFPQLGFAFAHFLAKPDWEFASVISASADKHYAFETVLDHYQLTADQVMAMGDSHSDMIFLERAGIGVAMGNASDDVKAIADYVTLDADDDGAAFALQTFIV